MENFNILLIIHLTRIDLRYGSVNVTFLILMQLRTISAGSTLELELSPLGPGCAMEPIIISATHNLRMLHTHGVFAGYFARMHRPFLLTLGGKR